MRFIDDFFPLLVTAHAARFDDDEFRQMVEGHERYFERNARHVVLSVSPGEFVRFGPRERKLIADWMNTPRVKETVSAAILN